MNTMEHALAYPWQCTACGVREIPGGPAWRWAPPGGFQHSCEGAGQSGHHQAVRLSVWSWEPDTIIAASPDDAKAVLAEITGAGPDDMANQEEWSGEPFELDAGDTLSVQLEPPCEPTVMTHAEWAVREGRCHLCSTEY